LEVEVGVGVKYGVTGVTLTSTSIIKGEEKPVF
jgi:hypothetical protein